MNIDQPIAKSRAEFGRQQPHESRQHHQVWTMGLKLLGKRCVKGLAIGELSMVEDLRRNPFGAGNLKAGRVRPVGNHRNHRNRPAMTLDCTEQCIQIGTASRDQHR